MNPSLQKIWSVCNEMVRVCPPVSILSDLVHPDRIGDRIGHQGWEWSHRMRKLDDKLVWRGSLDADRGCRTFLGMKTRCSENVEKVIRVR